MQKYSYTFLISLLFFTGCQGDIFEPEPKNSAAECFVLYSRVLPNVTVSGERTAGSMGEKIAKELPNG